MALELRKKNGRYLPFFYGRYYEASGSKVINTGVRWQGSPPLSMRDTGDDAFEHSRKKAQSILRRYAEAAQEARCRVEQTPVRWSEPDPSVTRRQIRLDALYTALNDRRYRRQRSLSWEKWTQGVINAFVTWCASHDLHSIRDIRRPVAEAYMAKLHEPDEKGRVRTAKTIRTMKAVLGMALARFLPEGVENPFKLIVVESRDGDKTFNRQPLDAREIERLLEAAKEDPLMFDLIVTGLSTGLRRGDVCRLRWESVNLKEGVLHLVTSKTQAKLYLPILPRLEEVLNRRLNERKIGDVFVFPEAEKLLKENPGGLTWRVKKAFTLAFANTDYAGSVKKRSRQKLAESLGAVIQAVENAKMTRPKRRRMIAVLQYYAEGKSYRFMLERLCVSRGTLSNLLKDAEHVSDIRFLPDTFKGAPGITRSIKEVTQLQRKVGRRRASKYDFHALRTSFVTLAINGGISIDKLRALTGHKTVDMVLKHYFKPKGTDVADDLERALPKVLTEHNLGPSLIIPNTLTDTNKTHLEHIFDVLRSVTPEEWVLVKNQMEPHAG